MNPGELEFLEKEGRLWTEEKYGDGLNLGFL
jgi:hypothetical protein